MRDRLPPLAAAVLAAAVLLTSCSSGTEETGELAGNVLDPPFTVDGTPLVADDGSPYSLTEDTDKPLTLVFFGYTNCPDICQQVMSTLALAKNRLAEADAERLDVVFVTTDPARDDEEAVGHYADQYDESFIGVTGELDTIVDVAEPLGIAVEKGKKLPSGGYEVTHGTQVVGIDGSDQAPIYWNADVSQAELAADIHTLLDD
ncbi:SCO family protein [Nocardioides gansuensis]|uniref:SCO family protein n=1 Tax=Nocardioides gansuensis TaxID=2138300 RepID=UPI001FE4951C|nr:SCO family protein [Nocardioides gansuensis]